MMNMSQFNNPNMYNAYNRPPQSSYPRQPLSIYYPPVYQAPVWNPYPQPTPPRTYPPQPKSVFVGTEGTAPGGIVMDAAQKKFPLTGDVSSRWKNYSVGSLSDTSNMSVKSDIRSIVYHTPGKNPTLEGGIAGDPEIYTITGTSQDKGQFHPPAGSIVRVFQDNGIVINNKYEDINPTDRTDNVAATESMATIIDPATGEKHTILLSDGQTKYTDPKGKVTVFDPNSTTPLIIGDPKDPLAKLEIKGGNPGSVPITLTHFERFDPATLKELQDRGIDPSFAAKVRGENEIRWGNRLSDGRGSTERAAAGTASPQYVNQYYDLHIVNKGSHWEKLTLQKNDGYDPYGGSGYDPYGGGGYNPYGGGGYNPYGVGEVTTQAINENGGGGYNPYGSGGYDPFAPLQNPWGNPYGGGNVYNNPYTQWMGQNPPNYNSY